MVLDIVLKCLEQKKNLSALEKDKVSSMSKYNEQPFDREGIKQKIVRV